MFLIAVAVGHLAGASAATENVATPGLHRLGTQLFQENCSICHGKTGQGDGAIANNFQPKPRDFTIGTFRFSTTPQGAPPSRGDILKVIETGIQTHSGTIMPSFANLLDSERLALAEVVRQFAEIDAYGTPIEVPAPGDIDVASGPELYRANGCIDCHGERGDGAGVLADSLTDESGQPIRPANFQVGKLKAGSDPARVWTTIRLGIRGTPMPSFSHLSDDEIWALTEVVSGFKQ